MEKKFIEVYDNIINPKLVNLVENLILKDSILPFIYSENLTYPLGSPLRKFKPGINHLFWEEKKGSFSPFSETFNNILYNFSSSKKIIIKQIYGGRVFIDLPTPNPKLDFPPHTDKDFPHWVCLYYVNDSDGDTVFFDDNKKEIERISPKKGRIAFFDGSIYHAGTPSETNSRAVINFNFIPYL
jgi:hypothetical protein